MFHLKFLFLLINKVAFVILYFSFIKTMENRLTSLLLHPREGLPQIAPLINLELGRFFNSVEEFNGGIKEISEIWEE